MAKTKKIIKRILITLLIAIVLIAVGAYCVFNFYIKPKYSDKIMEAVNVILEDEELMADIGEVLQDEELQAEINEVLSDSEVQADIDAALEGVDLEGITAENPQDGQAATAAPSNTAQPTHKPAQGGTATTAPEAAPTEEPKKNQSLMDKAKENVEPKDFADGLKLASKIDVGYILGLMSGGLTDEEKAEAKAYFKTKYTKAERNRIKGYMAKYSYLLE